MTVNLKVPGLNELKPRITVFGVGGAGGNAVNNMIRSSLEGVDFVVANTDAQALEMSCAERRIQMGMRLTEGLGAGSQPNVGRDAAEEARDEIRSHVEGVHMIFITAGMGGGTGTGAAPVIASVARELGILTVGVVTKPFDFEGTRRMCTAESGITEMQKYVDTLLVIPNQNLFRVADERTTLNDAFGKADRVLYSGVSCITSVIVKEGLINLDFADVRSIMNEMGKAMMGTGEATGERRAVEAAEAAISNPLLDNVSMSGARGLLISISGGNDLTLFEVDEAANRIREQVDPNANIILGATFDDTLEGVMRVSVVATGIDSEEIRTLQSLNDSVSESEQFEESLEVKEEQKENGGEVFSVCGSVHRVEKSGCVVEEKVQVTQEFNPSSDGLREQKERIVESALGGQQKFFLSAAEQTKTFGSSMPPRHDFPLPAQNQMRAQAGEDVGMGLQAHQEKIGFFKRIASIAMKKRSKSSDSVTQLNEGLQIQVTGAQSTFSDDMRVSAFRVSSVDPVQKDNESLEIPAFLRRQAN